LEEGEGVAVMQEIRQSVLHVGWALCLVILIKTYLDGSMVGSNWQQGGECQSTAQWEGCYVVGYWCGWWAVVGWREGDCGGTDNEDWGCLINSHRRQWYSLARVLVYLEMMKLIRCVQCSPPCPGVLGWCRWC
jgi:hypothetical protein